MRRMLPKPLRPYAPAIFTTVVGAIAVAAILHPGPMLVAGALLAFTISCTVTIEYAILVPLRKNPGAKRLLGLLTAIDLLLLSSILRYFFADYPFRAEFLTLMFWALFFALIYLGWHIWMDQLEGARAYRRNRRQEQAERKK